MKAKFFLLGLCALGLAACSIDEVSQINDTNAVTFRATTITRADVTTTNNLTSFSVWAWNGTNEFMDDVIATRSGTSSTFTTSPLYFWPTGTVDFYALTPATELCGIEDGVEYAYLGGEISEGDDVNPSWSYTGNVAKAQIANGNIVIDAVIPSTPKEQIDLCYGVALNQSSGSVPMNFRHALTQVAFKAKSTDEAFEVKIADVSVCSVYKEGVYTIGKNDTSEHLATSDLGTEGISGTQGAWIITETDDNDLAIKGRFLVDMTASVVDVPTNGDTEDLVDPYGVLILLPQEVDAWDPDVDYNDSELGSYIRILCNVMEHGSQIWPNNNAENEEDDLAASGAFQTIDGVEYAEIAVPFDAYWEQGYRYTYTIIFGNGLGYYPPDDPNTDLEGTPVLVPITFTVTVDEFQDADGIDVPTDTDYDIDTDERTDIIPTLNDENFKAYCIENYSTDGEHVWYPEETEGVTRMDFKNSASEYADIKDFTGLYWFENLEYFTSQTAKILDVSGNLELNHINLGGTDAETDPGAPIKTLDLSKNTKLTEISTAAFAYCAELTSITFPSTLTIIDFDAFEYCVSLESVDIPASVTEIRGDAFEGCTSLATATFNSTVTLDGRVFADCTALKEVVNSEYVLFSGNSAGNFMHCESLTYFKLNESVTSLEAEEFYYSGLTELDGIKQLISIGDHALEYTHLTSAALHEDLETIGDYAFAHCSQLAEEIKLPSTLTALGEFAFYESGITGVVISADDMTDGESNFEIEESVFAGCLSLTSVDLPNGWTDIGPYWFSDCQALTSIELPSTITTIEKGAFSSCGLVTISLPEGLTTLGAQAFQTCKSLTEVTIPQGVTSMDTYYAFSNCSALTYVDLPACITSIDDYAFYNCSQLETLILRAENVPSVTNANALNFDLFSLRPATHTLYVPAESVDAYEAAWGEDGTNTYAKGKFASITAITD